MKYIRTKDGVYEVDVLSIHYIGETIFCCSDVNYTKAFNNWHILKQADTIEELCDEFVLIKNGKPELFVRHNDEIVKSCAFKSFVKYDLPHSNKIEDVFGAIWTNKGLQFVARMNDEGVFELL